MKTVFSLEYRRPNGAWNFIPLPSGSVRAGVEKIADRLRDAGCLVRITESASANDAQAAWLQNALYGQR